MRPTRLAILFGLGLLVAAACGDEEEPPPDDDGGGLSGQTGQECVVADDCFATVDNREDIPGELTCLDRVEGGYCTHECTSDDDCCSVEGECEEGETQVCGPFESTGLMLCFISCEASDIGDLTEDEHCQEYHRDFVCRSTGGGANNRKVCVPGGGTPCEDENACTNADFPYCCEDSFAVYRCTDLAGTDGTICTNPPQ